VSKRVEGVVFKVYERDFRGKASYTIKIDGNPTWYRAGGKRFAGIAESGNRVAFDAEPNAGRDDAKITSDVVLAKATPAAGGAPSAGGGADRGNSIVYQSSRKDALALVTLLAQTGALKLPAAQAKKVGVIEAAVDRYTALFFDDVFTLGAVVREAEGAESEGDESEGDESDEGDGDEE